jgi:hypothetical protein
MKDLSYLEKLSIENLLPELVTVFDDKIAFFFITFTIYSISYIIYHVFEMPAKAANA